MSMSDNSNKSFVTDAPQPLYALAAPDAKVNLIIVYNPLNVSERALHSLIWGYRRSLAEYLDGLPEGVEWGVCVNAEPIDEELWDSTFLDPDDYITLMPLPAGGGGSGKGIMRMVALIAVAVVAWYAAPYIAGAALGVDSAAISAGMSASTLGGLAGVSTATAGISMAVAGGVVSMVGGMLVNAFLPPAKAKMPDSSWNSIAGGTDSPSYGIDGAKNTAAEDVPVPVVYGAYRMGGNIVNLRTENDGDNQWLYMMTALSEGEIESISDVLLNDQPLAQYHDVEIKTSLGTDAQAVLPWFDDTAASYSKGVKLTKDNWVTHSTLSEVDKVRVDMVFPAGLCATSSSDGSRVSATVGMEIQYRKEGTTAWLPLLDNMSWQDFATQTPAGATAIEVSVSAATSAGGVGVFLGDGAAYAHGAFTMTAQYRKVGTSAWQTLGSETGEAMSNYVWASSGRKQGYYSVSVTRTFRIDGLEPGTYEVRTVAGTLGTCRVLTGTAISVTAATRSALRRSYFTPVLDEAKYEIRARRTSDTSTQDLLQDVVTLADVWEISTEDVAYNHTAFLALKIKLTDQLSGIPKVTALVKGRKLPYYDRQGNLLGARFSANPAWVAIDILTNRRYGGGMDLARVDFSALADLADYCDARGLRFNGVFDFNTTIWDGLQSVLRVGHAQIISVGTRYSFAIEKPDEPAMMFSVANIVEDTFSIDWLPMEDRANDIEVTFYDEEDDYRRRSVKVYDQAALDRGANVRTASISLLGVTNADQAINEGWLQLALNRYILQTVSFDAPLEAIACTVGSLVYVQHDMPQWGFAGRTEGGSTNTVLRLDRPVTMEAGKVYKSLVHFDALKRYSGSIQTIIGTSLFVSGIADEKVKRVRRILVGGRDLRVLGVVASSPYKEVILESVADLQPGMTFELWDTEVLEERPVVNEPGETMSITLQAPLSGAPGQFVNWMFGETTKIKKPFRVLAISGSGDITRQLKCLEYNESVYADPEHATATPNYSSLSTAVGQVTITGAYEDLFALGTAIRTRLIVDWTPPAGLYDGAAIYVSVNGSAFENVQTIRGSGTSYSQEFNEGDHVRLKVVAIDGAGSRAAFNSAPMVERTIVGKNAPPSDVTGFKVEKTYGGLLFSWTPVKDVDVVGYEIRRGASWDSGETIIERYAGNTLTVALVPSGIFTWHIRAVDSTGHYSDAPATFTMQVTAPAVVKGFDVVQNQNTIQFMWQPNSEPDLVGYEIREGATWGSGVVIGTNLVGTRFSIPSNIPADRQFWIKATDRSKVQSELSAGAMARFNPIENHNVIVEQDEPARGWDGVKLGTEVVDGALVLSEGRIYGEYLHEMVLPASIYARNVVTQSLDAIVRNNLTWAEATFAWTDVEARRQWRRSGNIDQVSMEQYISRRRTLAPGELDGIALNGTTDSVAGVAASEALGITYADGRFRKGLLVSDVTSVKWSMAVPSEFRLSFWMRLVSTGNKARFLTLSGAAGTLLALDYDTQASRFVLVDDQNNRIGADGFGCEVAEPVFVTIVQTASDRRFFIGRPSDRRFASGSAPLGPRSAFNTFQLY